MARYYYALWIPVLKKTQFKVIEQPKPRILQDSKEFQKYTIKGEIEKSTLHFSFQYKKKGSKKWKKLSFQCTGRCSEGILVYSIDINHTPQDILEKKLQSKMPTFIYHLVKDFFHKHIHHHPSHDSLLHAYFSEQPLPLDNLVVKRQIMEHYAKCYQQKFEAAITDFQSLFSIAKENINSRRAINKGIKQLEFILNEGREILGECKFCHALMSMGAGYISKSIRQSISEAQKQIEGLQQHVSFSYNLCTSSYGIKLGYWGIWFGIGGIGVSIASFIASIYMTANQSPDYSPITNKMDSIERKREMQTDSLIKNGQEMNIRLDSLLKQIENKRTLPGKSSKPPRNPLAK